MFFIASCHISPYRPPLPLPTEIREADLHRGVVFRAAEEAEKVFQHPAAHHIQAAVRLERQAGQAGR